MKAYDRILQTASQLFHQQGYNSTGINQIIDEANVAKGSFYYNFKSKEEVCIAFLKARHDYWFDQLRAFLGSDTSNIHPVLSSFNFLSFMNKKEDFRGCSFLNILSEISKDNTAILQVIQNHKNDLRLYLIKLVGNELQGDHIYLLFESAIIESQLFKNQWPVVKAKAIVESLLK